MAAAAAGVQHPGCLVQQEPDVGPVSVCRACSVRRNHHSPSSNSPRQHHRAGERHQRGCDHRFRAPAVPFGEGDRLAAAPLGRGERMDLRHVSTMKDIRESELREAADFQVRAGRSPGPGRRLPGGGVQESGSPRDQASAVPRFISATARRSLPSAMSSSDCPVTGEARNLTCSITPARSPGALGQRQLQRRDRHLEAARATWRRRLGVRLGDRQVRHRFV